MLRRAIKQVASTKRVPPLLLPRATNNKQSPTPRPSSAKYSPPRDSLPPARLRAIKMSAKSGSPKAVPPLVPAPDSDFAAFVDSMTAALEAGTSHAAQFPDKSDLMFHRTLDRKFARGIDSSGQRVLKLADQLLQLTVDSQPKTKNRLKPRRKLADEDDVVDSFHSTVVEHVDSLLEDADHNLDEVNGELKKAAIQVNPSAHAMKNVSISYDAADDSSLGLLIAMVSP